MARFLRNFFGVVARGRSYLNLVHVILAFPLGLVYFVFLITGFSLAIGLWVFWIGIFLMALIVAAWWGLAIFERKMAIWLLGEDIPPMHRPDLPRSRFLDRVKEHFQNPVTWKSLAYLLLKFPLGVAIFCIIVTFLSLTAGLLAAPFTYQMGEFNLGFTQIDVLWKAILACGAGLLIGVVTLHVSNGLAVVSGWLARMMLGTRVQHRVNEEIRNAPEILPQAQPEVS
jgi:hypothetical protein